MFIHIHSFCIWQDFLYCTQLIYLQAYNCALMKYIYLIPES